MEGFLISLLENYGWAALILGAAMFFLIRYVSSKLPVWSERDHEQVEKRETLLKNELTNHQFFTNITYKINSEIPTLDFNGKKTPVRQKLFRKLLELKLITTKEAVEEIISADVDKMSPANWADFVQGKLHESDEKLERLARDSGIPPILISKFSVWRQRTTELLDSYINDLGISVVYSTNLARTNTLLYLLNLKLITIIGDAERALIELNGEISGLMYEGEEIE